MLKGHPAFGKINKLSYIIARGGEMVHIASGKWVVDLGAMTCRNYNNNTVVGFERQGDVLIGKIKDMPLELMTQWAGEPHGERKVQQAVMDAEDVFLRSYFEND